MNHADDYKVDTYLASYSDMPANGSELIQQTEASARRAKCESVVFRLSGTGAGMLEALQRLDYLARGWIQEEEGYLGYLELYKTLDVELK